MAITPAARAVARVVGGCPLGCGWRTSRKLLPSMWASSDAQLLDYVERVWADLADHLVDAHDLRRDALTPVLLCGLCMAGAGGECHTPGCALWMNRAPDVPVAAVANGDVA